MVRNMAMVVCCMPMDLRMWASGPMIKRMAMVCSKLAMARLQKANGLTLYKKAWVQNKDLMEAGMKACMSKAKRVVKACLC